MGFFGGELIPSANTNSCWLSVGHRLFSLGIWENTVLDCVNGVNI